MDSDNCWLWASRTNKRGYGIILVKVGDRWRNRMAHRVIYEALVGEIPQGLEIDHLCRVTTCINPAHLEPVTPDENKWRQFLAIRPEGKKSRGYCRKGHELNSTNLYIRKDGSRICRPCRNEQNRRYKHQDHVRARHAAYQREWRASK